MYCHHSAGVRAAGWGGGGAACGALVPPGAQVSLVCGRPTGQHCGRSALHPCTAQQAAGVHAALHCSAETLPVPHPPALNCSDELLAGVRLHRIGDYNLGWVEGRVGLPADGSEVRW